MSLDMITNIEMIKHIWKLNDTLNLVIKFPKIFECNSKITAPQIEKKVIAGKKLISVSNYPILYIFRQFWMTKNSN